MTYKFYRSPERSDILKDKFDFNNPEDFRRAERLAYDGTLDYTESCY